jgi:hypothetical protein
VQIGIGLGLTTGGGTAAWSPDALATNLLGWIDAEHGSTVTQSGGLVSAWADIVGARSYAQATGSSKPAYSTTSFNSRPGITYDGVDDELTLGSSPYPLSGAFEIWGLVEQTALPADVTARTFFGYGTGTASVTLLMRRLSSGGFNRFSAVIGNATSGLAVTHSTADFSGKCVVRLTLDGVNATPYVNGVAGTPVAVAASITAGRSRVGANASPTAAAFWQGGVNNIVITNPLSAADATLMLAYQKTRGGIA